MKKTAKILIGVLSVGALIGTGYATWHISGGFTGDEETLTPGVETVVDKNFGYIEVTAVKGDDFITFDGDANDDLTISYMVKAFANEGSDRNPYDLTNYEGIANEYIPNLKVETIVKEGDAELGKDDPFFKYVDLPSSAAIGYKTWLASENKDTGYKVTLNFSWSKETLGGQNPEQAWKGLSVEEQETKYQELISALKDVKFTFKFIVGNDDGVTEEPGTEEPVVITTGEITLPTIEGSTLTIDGLNDGKVEVGTHKISLSVTGENQFLNDSTITIYKTIGNDTTSEPLLLNETTATTRTAGLLYSADYTFEKDVIYSFDYKIATTFFFKDLNGLSYVGTDGYVYAWNGETKNAEFPGVKIEHVSWDAAGDGANLYTFNLVASDYTNIILSTGEFKSDDQGKSYFHKVSQTVDISLENFDSSKNLYALTGAKDGDNYVGEFVNYDEYFSDIAVISTKFDDTLGKVEFTKRLYREGDTIELKVTPYENYEVSSVTLNGSTNIEPINDIYTFTAVTGKNEVVVDFKEVDKEENYSISQITTAGEYTVRGVVVAKDNDSILIHDGTDGILAYDRKLDANVGDYVTINGGVRTYNKLYQFAFNADPAVNIVEVLNDENAPTLPEAKELTSEDLLRWKETDTLTTKDVELYKWNATCVDNNEHLALNLNGSDINISPTSSEFTSELKEGYEYSVEAYFIGYSNGSNYASVMLTEKPTLIEKNATSVEIVTDNTDVAVNGTLGLKFNTNPINSTNKPKRSSKNIDIASIDENTGVVTGVSEGEATIVLEMVDNQGIVTASDSIAIKVAGEVVNETFTSESSFGSWDGNDVSSNKINGSDEDAQQKFIDKFKESFKDYDKIFDSISGENAYINNSAIKLGAGSKQGLLQFKIKDNVKIDNITFSMHGYKNDSDIATYIYLDSTYENDDNLINIETGKTNEYTVDLSGQNGNVLTIKALRKSDCRFYITNLKFSGTILK